MTAVAIVDVALIDRHRNDLGDIKGLAESMTEVGLLQPIVVTPDNRLVAGHRRLVAAKSLGWIEIDAHVVSNLTDAVGLLRAESDENTCRKAFTPTEAEQIASAREALLRPLSRPGPKTGDGAKFASSGPTRKAASTGTGFSHETIRKVREVREVAEAPTTPEPVREVAKTALVEMDRSGKVDRAHKIVKQAVVAEESKAVTSYLESDQALQDRSYLTSFVKDICKADDLLMFDAERIGQLVDNDVMVSLDHLVTSIVAFRDRVKRARSGLRVIQGGGE